MASRPLPPLLPQDFLEFKTHANAHPEAWFEYCKNAYQWTEENEASWVQKLEQQSLLLAQQQEVSTSYEKELAGQSAVIGYQKELVTDLTEKLVASERSKALSTPGTSVFSGFTATPAAAAAATATAATPAAATATTAPINAAGLMNNRLSEKLPDPDKFSGERKDLRRFVSQIHEKLNVNRDRFATAQSRMAYVTNRLSGTPYAQVLPHIHNGICQLPDYEDILHLLERAYGDPNRINNARSELFHYQQRNKDFCIFLAEFQRLGLEAEMTDESLATLLEQAISKELKAMLMHTEPPSRKYSDLAAFLQNLDNRRMYYGASASYTTRTYAAAAVPTVTHSQPARSQGEARTTTAIYTETPGEPMDLGVQRRSSGSRRERHECYRCGSKDHFVAKCPHPDTRPTAQRQSSPVPSRNYNARPESPPRSRYSRSPPTSPRSATSSQPGNGTRLEEVASRR